MFFYCLICTILNNFALFKSLCSMKCKKLGKVIIEVSLKLVAIIKNGSVFPRSFFSLSNIICKYVAVSLSVCFYLCSTINKGLIMN